MKIAVFALCMVALAATCVIVAWAVVFGHAQYAIWALLPLTIATGAAKVLDNLSGGRHD